MTHPFFVFLLSFFNNVVNCSLDESEKDILRTGALTILTYKENMSKLRPIVVKDVILKIGLLCMLKQKQMTLKPLDGSTYGKKGGSATAVAIVQQKLNEHFFVLCCDAKNAFNLCSRFAAFEVLLSAQMQHMRDLFPLLTQKIEITTGTSQLPSPHSQQQLYLKRLWHV